MVIINHFKVIGEHVSMLVPRCGFFLPSASRIILVWLFFLANSICRFEKF